jgi:hypothetical protein
MQRDSPLGSPGYESIHMLCLDFFQSVLCFSLRGISPDSHPEWYNVSIHSRLIAPLDKTRGELFRVGFVIICSQLDRVLASGL